MKGGGWPNSDWGDLCGSVPTNLAGTTNYLVAFVDATLQGTLKPAGGAELARHREGLSNMATGTQVNLGNRSEQVLSANLPPALKETMDRIVADWIVDEDQGFNATSASAP